MAMSHCTISFRNCNTQIWKQFEKMLKKKKNRYHPCAGTRTILAPSASADVSWPTFPPWLPWAIFETGSTLGPLCPQKPRALRTEVCGFCFFKLVYCPCPPHKHIRTNTDAQTHIHSSSHSDTFYNTVLNHLQTWKSKCVTPAGVEARLPVVKLELQLLFPSLIPTGQGAEAQNHKSWCRGSLVLYG